MKGKKMEADLEVKLLKERWMALAHAVRSGVKYDQATGSEDGSPKHLRTGLNCAMSDHGALVQLLIRKGVITEREYWEAVVANLENEVRKYETMLSKRMGGTITLG